MTVLTLEIVEGPDAGKSARLAGTIEIGRDPAVDFALRDEQVSRHHARISSRDGGVVVEDLGSRNGTFVNDQPVSGPTSVAPGDDGLVGVSVVPLRTAAQVAAQPSAVRPVPPALAVPERRPTFVDPLEDAP